MFLIVLGDAPKLYHSRSSLSQALQGYLKQNDKMEQQYEAKKGKVFFILFQLEGVGEHNYYNLLTI